MIEVDWIANMYYVTRHKQSQIWLDTIVHYNWDLGAVDINQISLLKQTMILPNNNNKQFLKPYLLWLPFNPDVCCRRAIYTSGKRTNMGMQNMQKGFFEFVYTKLS